MMILVACVVEEGCCYDYIYCWYKNDDFCSMCCEEGCCCGTCCCCCCKNGASCEAGDVFLAGICSLFFGWAVFIVGEYSLNRTTQADFFMNFPQ